MVVANRIKQKNLLDELNRCSRKHSNCEFCSMVAECEQFYDASLGIRKTQYQFISEWRAMVAERRGYLLRYAG
jgi:hypothetical protein